MIKVMKNIKDKAEEQKAYTGKGFIRTLRLGDGETASLRFLTDKEDIIEALMHTVVKVTPQYTSRPKVYCKAQDGQPCEYDAQGIPATPMYFLWAYVYEIMHKEQNPKLARFPDAVKYERLEKNGEVGYKEAVNGPMLFRTGPGKDKKYKNMLINLADEYSTLCDRDYKYKRTGSNKDNTDYSLIGKDQKKMTKEIIEVQKSLPDLGDVVSGKIKSLEPEEQTAGEADNKADTDDGLF